MARSVTCNLQRALIDDAEDRAPRLEAALRQGRTHWTTRRTGLFLSLRARPRAVPRPGKRRSVRRDRAGDRAQSQLCAGLLRARVQRAVGRPADRRGKAARSRDNAQSARQPFVELSSRPRLGAFLARGIRPRGDFARRATRQPNVTYRAFATLAASLGHLGDRTQAEIAATELRQRKPNYSTGTARQEFFFCNDAGFIDQFVEGLCVAGISDV